MQEGHLDFTGAQMVLTLRLIAIGVSYQDGSRPAERLSEYGAKKQLQRLPSLQEFFSYLFAAGNLLAGPFFEAKDYLDYIERKVLLCCRNLNSPRLERPWPARSFLPKHRCWFAGSLG